MTLENKLLSILEAVEAYLTLIEQARSPNTARSYRNALNAFLTTLKNHGVDPPTTTTQQLGEEAIAWFATNLKAYTPATEQLYLTAVAGFYEYLAAESLSDPNLPRLRLLLRQRSRRPGQRLPQFPLESIDKLLRYANNLANTLPEDQNERLILLRDRAFLLTLADSGLRVHEACALRRGDVDWNEAKAVVVGKGNRQAVVRFSRRSLKALRDYLRARAPLDGASGRPLPSLPLFARHDRGAGRKVKPITTATGRNIVTQRVIEALGPEAAGSITPHSLRHYFVTAVLRGSGGNLKLAQELARHRNIAVTQRYAHLADDELDRAYMEIFDSSSNFGDTNETRSTSSGHN